MLVHTSCCKTQGRFTVVREQWFGRFQVKNLLQELNFRGENCASVSFAAGKDSTKHSGRLLKFLFMLTSPCLTEVVS